MCNPVPQKPTLLPADLKKEVDDFIEFFLSKKKKKLKSKRPLGLAEGLIEMSDDFDDLWMTLMNICRDERISRYTCRNMGHNE